MVCELYIVISLTCMRSLVTSSAITRVIFNPLFASNAMVLLFFEIQLIGLDFSPVSSVRSVLFHWSINRKAAITIQFKKKTKLFSVFLSFFCQLCSCVCCREGGHKIVQSDIELSFIILFPSNFIHRLSNIFRQSGLTSY